VDEHIDVIVVGAGLSGIGAAYHLQHECPHKSCAIFEARDALGGTWDLFRYPGIRSDSDMFTLGYSFRPWTDPKAIADGASILSYIQSAAETNGILQKITFGTKVVRARWSTDDAMWTAALRAGALDCCFVDDAPGTTQIYMPHLVTGGGYTTRVFLVKPTLGWVAGNIRFRTADGLPVPVTAR